MKQRAALRTGRPPSRELALLSVGLILVLGAIGAPATAQQTGAVTGTVTSSDGQPLPGVTVEASGDVLPLARSAQTGADGGYRFELLPPGNYELTYSLDGMSTETRELRVLLQQTTRVDVTMGPDVVSETISVIGSAPLIDTGSAEIKAAIDSEVISALPVGQEYRDLIKLIPGVQYTEDSVRGPSAGGSGQDNVYLFDGVNVGLPLFGVLSAEPSSHDIEQISIVKGGAKATEFNRSGGFTFNSVSKSGTNLFKGDVSYQIQTDGMTGDRDTVSDAEFEQDRDWATVSLGGPVVQERLFFYASYYRPTVTRDNRNNLYGDVPDFDSTRDELFGKLTFTPADNFLLSGSYRDSEREVTGSNVGGEATAGTASEGSLADLTIGILEGSWVLTPNSFLGFKLTDYEDINSSGPDLRFDFDIFDDGSVPLNVGALDTQGLFQVPQPISGESVYNAFIQPLIDRYGYVEGGTRLGGGLVGGASTINDQDFFRESYEVNWDYLLGGETVSHDIHVGYQWSEDQEDLSRESNGWGLISVPGGRFETADGVPYFYEARFQQQSLLSAGGTEIPAITSKFETQSLEVNDTITIGDWAINVGVMASNDQLFGQGLRENSSTPSGFEIAVGNEYKMYEIDWEDMIAPRLGVTWNFKDLDTAYASYARYYPAASSLPRAASWARNNRREIRARFDAAGNLLEVEPVASSSGKFFADDLDPRFIDEYLIGYSTQLSRRWTGKAYARYRYAANFWEDTNNNARSAFNAPAGIPQEDYIPELNDYRFGPNGIGGSSYVIAELDGAFTKYYEATFEAEYRTATNYLRGSYVWSHYYGNFDQDNTTAENDAAIFIGSSFLADGAGRQIWDNRYGDLRGDRRHQLKVFGSHDFPWQGQVGAYAIFQSGQPWEAWNVEVYRNLTSSTSDTSRFAEPAGSRTTSDHYQLDLRYVQNFRIGEGYNFQVVADVFNVFDKQTGYNVQNRVNSAGFGEPRSFFDPRRLQLLVRFQF